MRKMTLSEMMIGQFDAVLRTLFADSESARPSPASSLPHPMLTHAQVRDAARKMRVNHAGEISAQALYHAHAFTARSDSVRNAMDQSAKEEIDHLVWCEQRLEELGSHKSLLNPLWYGGSFVIGILAGLAGDEWSLGFVAETERQVVAHLQTHIDSCAKEDVRTVAILTQMQIDEGEHASSAQLNGATQLPQPIPFFMRLSSKVLTTIAAII